jgi:type VI secretion system secreted protein VgrG
MGLHTSTEIYLFGGLFTSQFNSFSLYQEIGNHHHLEIAFRTDEFEKLLKEKETSSLFGEKISIKIVDDVSNQILEFVGCITQVNKTKTDQSGSGDEIIIIAKSPTIFADNGSDYKSFIEKSPSEIVEAVLGNFSELKTKVSNYPNKLPYSVQHNESAFQYVCRLGAQYGQWCYYDGSKFIFGNPTSGDTAVKLHYQYDLLEFNYTESPQPTEFTYSTYDISTKKNLSSSNSFGDGALKANDLRDANTNLWINEPTGRGNLGDVVKIQAEALAINQVRFTGSSTNPTLLLGMKVQPTGTGDADGKGEIEGTFRIIKISHSCNEIGNYQNQFEAVSTKYSAYPYTNVLSYPVSQNQIGQVIQTHEDPDSLGRIQVRLSYHDGFEPIWMRMLTPHPGNKHGIFFLPEVGDEVLVGFEGNNAEHPYVMGCLYNGKDKPPHEPDDKNTLKTIKTRSGLRIEFNDEDKIFTIETPAKNTIVLDEKEKSITIADQNKNTITMDASGITIDSCKDLILEATGDVKITAKMNIELKATADANVSALNIAHKANAAFSAKGGATAELSGSATTTIKGAMVMIN